MEEKKISVKKILLRFLCFILVTILMLVIFLFCVMRVVCKGPSQTAAELFVRSVRETSAIGFLADIFFTDEEIAAMEASSNTVIEETDTSLITVSTPSGESSDQPFTDAWGHTDADGDGLIYEVIHGSTYTGYMLIVLDPSRVKLGCFPNTGKGYTVQEFVEMNDAVAGINGGGFADENGQGDGSMPDTAYVHDGTVYYGSLGVGRGFIGIDDNYILHVGLDSLDAVEENHIVEGTGFGPVLVVNGEMADEESLLSGLNPRTAIGQRSDGAILLLVIDGRQTNSLGASYTDLAEIMVKYGAVNACNLDGGSSTLMWFNGQYVNNCASVIGIRTIPTSFIVLKKGAADNG
ncbi:MAG: phosphodiester glycosidase family protein [Eubacteriales bacterium]|nr:phosphodiester glycosidase family protein [Eubacteriales bacterium]